MTRLRQDRSTTPNPIFERHKIQAERAQVLADAYATNPHRFRRKPVPPALPEKAWINDPKTTNETETPAQSDAA